MFKKKLKSAFILISMLAIAGGCGDGPESNNAGGDCAPGDITGEPVEYALSGDVTFCGQVVVENTLYNDGNATITIKPGTNFIVGSGERIEFGYAGNDATVNAVGTDQAPIVFRGSTPDPGHWRSLIFTETVSSSSVFENIEIRHAGSNDDPALDIRGERGLTVSNVTVEDVGDAGVRASSFGEGSSNLTVANAGGPAVVIRNAKALNNFPIGGDFGANDESVVVIASGAMTEDTVIRNPGVPYRVDDTLYNNESIELTIEPGVEFQVSSGVRIEFGYAGNDLTLNAVGTEQEPIRFVGSSPDPGHWDRLLIQPTVASSSVLEWVEFEHTGSRDNAGLYMNSPITLRNITFRNVDGPAFRVEDGFGDSSENVTVENDNGASGELYGDSLLTLPQGGVYGTGSAFIDLPSGQLTESGTIPALSIPYRISDTFYNNDAIDLTIAAGTVFEVASGVRVEFGYASNDITLTADDVTFRATSGNQDHWDRLILNSTVSSSSSITNSTISGAGSRGNASVYIASSAAGITFTGNTITNTSEACIDRNGETTDYASSNTFECGSDYQN